MPPASPEAVGMLISNALAFLSNVLSYHLYNCHSPALCWRFGNRTVMKKPVFQQIAGKMAAKHPPLAADINKTPPISQLYMFFCCYEANM